MLFRIRWKSLTSLFLVTGLLAAAFALPASNSLAQDPPKKTPVKEEEDPFKPASKNQEDPFKPAGKATEMKKPPASKESIKQGPYDLAKEAADATHPVAKKLFGEFVGPVDLVTTVSGQNYKTAPIPTRFENNQNAQISFTVLDTNQRVNLQKDQIKEVSHYELRAMAAVRAFLDAGLDKANPPLTRFEQLRVAEKVITEIATYHKNARTSQIRDKSWGTLDTELERRSFDLQIDEVRALAAQKDYGTAMELADMLFGIKSGAKSKPGDKELVSAIESLYVQMADEDLAAEQYLPARQKMEILKDIFRLSSNSAGLKRIVERLENRARERSNKAKELATANDRSAALASLEEAEQAWPTLPGLREMRIQLFGQFSVLRVGVRSLPTRPTPLNALSTNDYIASQLMFESMVTARNAPSDTLGYVCKLCEVPQSTPSGLVFTIPDWLKWSDGKPVTAADFDRSAELVTTPKSPLFDPVSASLLNSQSLSANNFSVGFKPGQSHINGLPYLGFKIFPVHRLPKERDARDPSFANTPVGTGPYVMTKVEQDEVVFSLNPHYKRPFSKTGPMIQEVRFIKYTDWQVAKQALNDGRWQLLLDANTKESEELKGNPQVLNVTSTQGKDLINPRIYYLGYNHSKIDLQNLKLREAIHYSIDRDGILTKVFRGTAPSHNLLNGPFPVNSWASDKEFYAATSNFNPFNSSKARGSFSAANFKKPLKMICLDEDKYGVAACNLIKEDLAKTGLNVELAVLPGSQFQVELNKGEFDLIYNFYDYPNELYSLSPLLDPSAAVGGGNYMQYGVRVVDGKLSSLLQTAQKTRDRTTLERTMLQTHKHILENVVFSPLWQLDVHLGVHRSLEKVQRFHPIYIFDGVENWALQQAK